jgi:signal transduction histidine kinase
MTPHPERLFRYAGLAASCVIAGYAVAEHVAAGTAGVTLKLGTADLARATAAYRFMLVAIPAWGLVFAGLFWWITSERRHRRSVRTTIILLAVHTAIGLSLPQECLIIVAGEAGYALRGKASFLWIAFQSLIEAGLVAGSIIVGDCVPIEGISHLSKNAACTLTGVSAIAWTLFAYFAGYLAAAEGRERRALARANAELRATQNLLEGSSRLAERLRIARELHDSLGHHLTGVSLQLQLAARLAQGEAVEPIGKAHMMARLTLNDVRDALSALRADRSLDLRGALEELSSGIPEPQVHLSVAGGLEIRDPATAHVLFRCAQEIITNAIRHSGARNLWLTVGPSERGLELAAKDDGRGAAKVEAGNGLRGMRERVEEIGGRVDIDSRAGAGFHISILLPQTEELS